MFHIGPPATPKHTTTPTQIPYISENPTPRGFHKSQSYVNQSNLDKQAKLAQQERQALEQQARDLETRLKTLGQKDRFSTRG